MPTLDTKPQVTVVIAAYQASGFIARAIASALAQDGVRLEVVVVDDASPDDTADRVAALRVDRPEIRLIRLDRNVGPSVARNTGLRAARADWVAVLDADDAFEPGRLSRLLSAGQASRADVVADNIRTFDAAQQTISAPRYSNVSEPSFLNLHSFAGVGRPGTEDLDLGLLKPMYRRQFLLQRNIYYPEDIRHGEDFSLYFNLIRSGAKFLVLPEAGYLWTVRNSGHSRTRIDYSGQMREAWRLARLAGVRDDRRLVGLLQDRARALSELDLSNRFEDAKAGRRYARLLALAVRHPGLARQLSSDLLRKMAR